MLDLHHGYWIKDNPIFFLGGSYPGRDPGAEEEEGVLRRRGHRDRATVLRPARGRRRIRSHILG